MVSVKDDIIKFLNKRPETLGVFGYGSGVNPQKGYTENDKPQVDLIIAVANTQKWHLENMRYNPKDYSLSGKLYLGSLPKSWQTIGTDICYIPYIRDSEVNKEFKIGIIDRNDLIEDLKEWKSFYLAGRFQKPILAVKSDEEINQAIIENRRNALIIAKMLLNENEVDNKSLYKKICSLSYIGDPRMGIAENPHKIDNIVEANYESFVDMYSNMDIEEESNIEYFPRHLLNHLMATNVSLTDNEQLKKIITAFFESKNQKASCYQALKGIVTAGLVKSFNYGMQKRSKYLKYSK